MELLDWKTNITGRERKKFVITCHPFYFFFDFSVICKKNIPLIQRDTIHTFIIYQYTYIIYIIYPEIFGKYQSVKHRTKPLNSFKYTPLISIVFNSLTPSTIKHKNKPPKTQSSRISLLLPPTLQSQSTCYCINMKIVANSSECRQSPDHWSSPIVVATTDWRSTCLCAGRAQLAASVVVLLLFRVCVWQIDKLVSFREDNLVCRWTITSLPMEQCIFDPLDFLTAFLCQVR